MACKGSAVRIRYAPPLEWRSRVAIAAIIGGTTGSYFGSRKFDHTLIKRLLAVVLLIAGTKLILTT